MSRRKQSNRSTREKRRQDAEQTRRKNKTRFQAALHWFVPKSGLYSTHEFHGNTKWKAEELVTQALIWSWQETKHVTDAFDQALEICGDLGMNAIASSYTSMMNGLARYDSVLTSRLRERLQRLAEEIGASHFETGGWIPIGFDGSRATAPRSISNEKALCAPTRRQRYSRHV